MNCRAEIIKVVKIGQCIWAKVSADYIHYLRRMLAIFKVA